MSAENFLKYIVTSLVDKPESISIREIQVEQNTIVELRVAPEDIGKVIGRNGRIAKSLRTLMTAFSTKEGKNYSLEIVD
ncbi:MAG: KH domain-containing protein [Leptospiraceae bacterium]|nr:KH domain-containing protein [Leptospiraceae bacterium]